MSHARLSPSKAARWLRCPGSIREEAAYPDESGQAAIDGTHTHTLLEHCIKGGMVDPTAMVGVRLKDDDGEFVVDAGRAARAKVAIDYIKRRIAEIGDDLQAVIPEKKVNPQFLMGRDDLSGTADVQLHWDGGIEIIDYKDGMGEVKVEGNEQLELYALGVLAGLQMPINLIDQSLMIRLTVVQPKLALRGALAITHHDMKAGDLLAKIGYYVRGAAATDAPDAPLIAGDHCKFCKHKSCSTRAETVMKEIGVMFPAIQQVQDLAEQAASKDPATMTNDQLAQIMLAAPLVRQMIEQAEAETLERLKAGQRIPGLKVVHGRGSRSWTLPEDEMAEKLIKMGVPKSAVYETKLVSPAKAEKLTWEVTKAGEKVRKSLSERQLKTIETEYVAKVAGKLTVAVESDPRAAVVLDASPLFQAVEAQPESLDLPDWLKVV